MPVETFLQRVKLVSLTYVRVCTSLSCLKFVGFIYVPARRRDDVTVRSEVQDVNKWIDFIWVLGNTFLRQLRRYMLIKVAASTLLKRHKDVGLI